MHLTQIKSRPCLWVGTVYSGAIYCLLVALLFQLVGCGTTTTQRLNEPKDITVVGTFTHNPSGFSFPDQFGQFNRSRITQYDTEQRDITVGYDGAAALPITITIGVSPSPNIASVGSPVNVVNDARVNLCARSYAGYMQAAHRNHPDIKILDETPGNASNFTFRSLFEFTGTFAGNRQLPITSELIMSCYVNDQWTIEYRYSYPKGYNGKPITDEFRTTFERNYLGIN